MHFQFAVVLMFFLVGAAFIGLSLLASRFLRPNLPDPLKSSVYECGERPIGRGRFNFNPRFYTIALIFIVFEVEIALTYPVAVVVREWVASGKAGTALLELGIFIAVLGAALAYVWRAGYLDWERKLGPEETGDGVD